MTLASRNGQIKGLTTLSSVFLCLSHSSLCFSLCHAIFLVHCLHMVKRYPQDQDHQPQVSRLVIADRREIDLLFLSQWPHRLSRKGAGLGPLLSHVTLRPISLSREMGWVALIGQPGLCLLLSNLDSGLPIAFGGPRKA